MPSSGSTAMNSVNNAGSLASTSIFEENMSTLVDWSPSSNINSSSIVVIPPSSTASVTSSSSLSSPSLSLSPVVVKPDTPTIITTTTSIQLNEEYETVGVRGGRLTTINCPSNHPCSGSTSNEDQVTDSLLEKYNSVDNEQEEDEDYASGDESTNIDDDIFIEVSSISDRSDEELRYNTRTEINEEETGLLFGFDENLDTMKDNLSNISLYNSSGIENVTNDNDTYILLGDGRYPSGFSTVQTILAAVAGVILMFVVIIGNMLVIIAIATEKALKNIQNWFIASLAVADFFLGLIIMPFSLANEILGYWVFGYWWCDIYSAMDVLLCTASIMNLCLISLDRYWSITQAIQYLKRRTPARAALMIALVWLLSGLVCIPPLLGWKRPRVEEEYPKCRLSEDIGYVLYSALGSFYIPSCIMVFVYISIYFAAKKRARRGIRKQPRPRPAIAIPPESPDIRQTSFTQLTPATDSRLSSGINTMDNVATIESPQVQIPIVTCDYASDVSTSEADPGANYTVEEKDTLKVNAPMPMQKLNLKATLSVNGSEGQSSSPGLPARCRAPSVGIDVDMVSEFDPSSSDSGVVSKCAVVKPLKLRICRPIFGKKAINKVKKDHSSDGKHANRDGVSSEGKAPKPRDPEREKRRIARKKEKRATLILGLIMGSFIACWLPFFLLYILKPLFPNLNIPGAAFAVAFWLGYMNSAFNPVIYTVFNKDFRRAFRRLLYK